jgi:hypothetical protein
MLRRFIIPTSRLLLWIFVTSFVPLAPAADWNTPTRQLVEQIAASTGPGAVSLDITNQSSLSSADVNAISALVRSQLGGLGLRLVAADQAAAVVQLTLSENLQTYLWVARVQQGNAPPAIVMVSAPRPDTPAVIHEPAVLLIRKIQLWSQTEPILDVAVIDSSPPQIIVLDPERIALYVFQNNRWDQQQSFTIAHARPWPRDVRGRLVLRKDHLVDAYLPGTICSSTASSPLAITCRDSDDPWPVGSDLVGLNAFYSPNRNFFTGALSPGIGKQTTVKAFYSAAPILRDKYALWVLSGTDGQVHEVDGINDNLLSRLGWGSDLASVRTSCGSGTQVLATSNSDGTTADRVRAFEIPDRDPVPVSEPLEFNGPVTALWTESTGSGAVVVSRNLQTGKYEAFRLAITCGQ